MKYLTGVILTILAACLSYLSVYAVDFEKCYTCHYEFLNRYRSPQFLHPPYAEKQCGECHTADESQDQPATDASATPETAQKIQRLADSGGAERRHGFLLPGEKVGDTLIIDLQSEDGKSFRQEVSVPPLDVLPAVEDSGLPPVISDVQVLNFQRGAFLSATISWRTDSLTDATVLYGTSDLSQKSEPCARLSLEHQVVIFNLKRDQIYRYSVVSTDLFGRSQATEPLEFSTADPDQATPPSQTMENENREEEGVVMTSRLRKLGTDYLLEINLDKPAWVLIGSSNAGKESRRNRGLPDDESHEGLSSKAASSISACLGCHKAHAHPVNINLKEGMTILPEYPVLPDGRITCSSCHAPHGSDFHYMTRRDFRFDLCIGCHTDWAEKK